MKIFSYNAKSVLVVSIGSLNDGCIIDLACIFYIFLNKSWFQTYKVVNGTILLANIKKLSIISVGIIQIRVCDGIVRTLEVWQV